MISSHEKENKMPVDPVLPHDLDDLYGPGAEDAVTTAESFATAKEKYFYLALDALLSQFIVSTNMTDTYCDVCETHAAKRVDWEGNWTGQVDPINHKPDCVIGKVENILARG
jgi:hypothetical protein